VTECVPNFSEGRDPRIIADLADSIRRSPGVDLLDHSADPDHNRSVFTFTGESPAVVSCALAAARVAVERIDLSSHAGVHPRIGAVDVVPFVPFSLASLDHAADLAREFAGKLWEQLRVPVFFYEHAAVHPERRNLEQVRRLARDGASPDIGKGRHPTAGACAVGARDFLIAWNIWLDTADLELARHAARAIRFSSGGFAGVKALGLPMASKGIVQVSINTTSFRATPLHLVFEKVRNMAARSAVQVLGSELIGMIPQEALELSAQHDLCWLNLTPARVLRTMAH
jgi:glutamate formiminotransferase